LRGTHTHTHKRTHTHTITHYHKHTHTPKGIKAIKLYAWEEPYVERISALREDELRAVRKTQLLGMVRPAAPAPPRPAAL
jgi:hypothetical protein